MYNFPVWREPPVRDWLFHPERSCAAPGRKHALRRLCHRLDIEPVLTGGAEWLGMWATIGVLLAHEHGGLKPRGRKKMQRPGARIDVEIVKMVEDVADKLNLPFEAVLPRGIEWASRRGKLALADRSTDSKRLKRVKRRLDDDRRPVKGLLNLSTDKAKWSGHRDINSDTINVPHLPRLLR